MVEPSFVVFGDDWGAHPSSVQHLFRRLARTHRTLWVNTLGLRPPRLDRRDAARALRKLRRMLDRPAAPPAGAPRDDPAAGLDLHVLAPPMLPWMRPAPLRAVNRASLRHALAREVRRLGLVRPVLLTTVPNGVEAVGMGEGAVVYYCVDDFTNWPGVDATAAALLERELLQAADGVLATSEHLAHTRTAARGPTELLPHGVDLEHFATASEPGTVPLAGVRRGRPVLGYLGLVDERLDVPLVSAVARARPEWDLVFVGPTDRAPDPRLSLPNIRFVPAVPYARVPAALAAFDVALLPYVRNELTRAINPLKLREYLASGRPVLATGLPEVRRFEGLLAVADEPDDFVRAAQALLDGPRDLRAPRREALAHEGWDDRAARMLDFCRRAVERHAAR